jgi:hypothetical protein
MFPGEQTGRRHTDLGKIDLSPTGMQEVLSGGTADLDRNIGSNKNTMMEIIRWEILAACFQS